MAVLVSADHERVLHGGGDLAEILCRILHLEADQDLAAITTLNADLVGEAALSVTRSRNQVIASAMMLQVSLVQSVPCRWTT